jgi:hypothetical protein
MGDYPENMSFFTAVAEAAEGKSSSMECRPYRGVLPEGTRRDLFEGEELPTEKSPTHPPDDLESPDWDTNSVYQLLLEPHSPMRYLDRLGDEDNEPTSSVSEQSDAENPGSQLAVGVEVEDNSDRVRSEDTGQDEDGRDSSARLPSEGTEHDAKRVVATDKLNQEDKPCQSREDAITPQSIGDDALDAQGLSSQTPQTPQTPNSILGKRKAVDEIETLEPVINTTK